MVEKKMTKFTLKGPKSQRSARELLENALRENRFPQSVLIEGNRGIGKKALAIELAQTLSCTDPDERPCGKCLGCKLALNPGNVQSWVIPLESVEARAKSAASASEKSTAKTVEEIKAGYIEKIFENPYSVSLFSGISLIAVEQIRNMTSQFAKKSDGVRFVIVAEADKMNESASNAFLKTLEEVPPDTYFILTSSAPGKLLQTIHSRCLRLRLPPLSSEDVKSVIASQVQGEISPDALGMSLGSPGMALRYHENLVDMETLAVDFLQDSVAKNYSDLFFDLEKAFPRGESVVDDAVLMLEFASFLIGDALRLLSGEEVRMPERKQNLVQMNLAGFGAEALEKALLEIQRAAEKISARKNSVLVALQTLSIGLLEGYKK